MPWRIERRGNEYCVVKYDGETEACHATRTEAKRHMRALYASEKEASMDMPAQLCGGATTFAELRETADADEAAYQVRDLTWQFQEMVGNIMASDIEDKVMAVKSLTEEFVAELERLPKRKSLWDKAKSLFQRKEEPDKSSFFIWKEGEQWRWLAIATNKFRDEDNPPEILSEAAHQDFVRAVDSGEWPMPVCRIWHVPGADIGVADFVAYDDKGFLIVSGYGDEKPLRELAKYKSLGTSHGMPASEIERDPDDPTIITRYRSEEVGPLPMKAAANKLTAFAITEETMALPDEKRKMLVEVLGEEETARLEEQIESKALAAEGLEYKEAEMEEEVDEESEEIPQGDPPITREEIAEAVSTYVDGQIGELNTKLDSIVESLQKQAEEILALTKQDEEKIAEMVEMSPPRSIADMLTGRAVGSEETRIDGRTSLAKAGPVEETGHSTGIKFVDQQIAASRR